VLNALAAAGAWLLAPGAATVPATAQDAPPVVAVLRVTGGEPAARVGRIFLRALGEIGYEDGRTMRLVEYSANHDVARLPTLADKIAAERPAVIIAMGPSAARAIRAATSSIPIIAFTSFPTEAGLAASLSRPGGNLTGVSLLTTELDAKRLSLLGEVVPAARRIAVLRDPAIGGDGHVAQLEATGRSLGVTLDIVDANRPEEIASALRLAKSYGAEAVNVLASPMLNGMAGEIVAVTRQSGLPTICQWREMAEAGCVLSYGPSFLDSYRLAAKQIDKVLRGAKPTELPIEQPTQFELVVNLQAARALGLDIPPSVLARADEVIE
jgi:putative ABC transport system substrate-binding protein